MLGAPGGAIMGLASIPENEAVEVGFRQGRPGRGMLLGRSESIRPRELLRLVELYDQIEEDDKDEGEEGKGHQHVDGSCTRATSLLGAKVPTLTNEESKSFRFSAIESRASSDANMKCCTTSNKIKNDVASEASHSNEGTSPKHIGTRTQTSRKEHPDSKQRKCASFKEHRCSKSCKVYDYGMSEESSSTQASSPVRQGSSMFKKLAPGVRSTGSNCGGRLTRQWKARGNMNCVTSFFMRLQVATALHAVVARCERRLR